MSRFLPLLQFAFGLLVIAIALFAAGDDVLVVFHEETVSGTPVEAIMILVVCLCLGLIGFDVSRKSFVGAKALFKRDSKKE